MSSHVLVEGNVYEQLPWMGLVHDQISDQPVWRFGVGPTLEEGVLKAGQGLARLTVHEIIHSETMGPLAVYTLAYWDPEGSQLGRQRTEVRTAGSVKARLTAYGFGLASGKEAA